MATNGFIDRIAINQALQRLNDVEHLVNVRNSGPTTQPFRDVLRGSTDKRKDIDAECGYPTTAEITLEDYQRFYDRLPEGKKAVNLLPKETWKVQPQIVEGDEDTEDTPFLKAWDEVCGAIGQLGQSYHRKQENSTLWNYLRRFDELSGVGHYGVLLIGLNDKKKLNEPVEGIDEVTGEFDGKERSAVKSNRKITFLQPFSEINAEVIACEEDESSPRFGAPTMYQLDFESSTYGGTQLVTKDVHWTRVIHFADNLDGNDYIGVPRQRPCFNQLINLYLLYGCSAEMFWNGAFPTEWFTTHPQLGGDVQVDLSKFRQQQEKIKRGLQRWGLVSGLQPIQLPPIVADPSVQIAVNRKAITLILDIPDRIFEGSERGELSSAQDSDEWEGRLGGRRNNVATPGLVCPVVDRFIAYGVLPAPSEDGYGVKWPEKDNASALDKAQKNLVKVQTAAAYVGGNVETLIERKRFLTEYMDMTEEEADANIKETEAYEEEVAAEEEAMMQQQMDQQLKLAKAQGKPAPGQQPPGKPPFGGKPAAGGGKPNPFTKNAQTDNVFCPTGEGGGVDPTCSPVGGSGSKGGLTDEESIARMAPGAIKRLATEGQGRVSDDRLKEIEAHQPVWTTVKGVEVLKSPHSNLVAVPVSGKRNSATYSIIDVEAGEEVTQLKRAEVNGWLAKRSMAALENS